ncbi:AMP-binding enzyme [Ancylobacter aquaticus]|uniref:AMP-binding enzyme n=1 Tax=Ancylobacter aquaticus TaxID=100 RepID=A0A4R1IA35_ANCAQ|nr:AMP-binding enzyme [Ancylobacter aquaticus]
MLRPRMSRIAMEETLAFKAQAKDSDDLPEEAHAAIGRAGARPFDIAHGPLWRCCVYTVGGRRTIVLLVFHHLIFDGFSRDVFAGELAELITALSDGRTPPVGQPRFQSTDVAEWERRVAAGPRGEQSRAWWRERFGQAHPSAALPAAPGQAERDGSMRVAFPDHLAEALRARAAALKVPPGALALAAAALTLSRVTVQRQILLCTPLTNREQAEAAAVIGYLNRVVPLSVALPPTATLADIVSGIARDLFAANRHRFLPTAEIVATAGLARARTDQFMAAWQERRREAPLAFGRLPVREMKLDRESADFALALQFEADGPALSCRISHRAHILGPAGAAAFGTLLRDTLTAMVEKGIDQPIGSLTPPTVDRERLRALLVAHPGIDEAAVTENPQTGGMSAWMVLNEYNRASADELTTWLGTKFGALLPPLRFSSLPALPRTATGAVDLETLVALDDGRGKSAFNPPENDVERIIADLWQKALWLDHPIGRHENFRELGGHSLLAVRMLSDLEKTLGRRLSANVLLQLGTVAELAAALVSDEAQEHSAPAPAGHLDPDILARLRAYTASWEGRRPFPGAVAVGHNLDGARPPLFWCLQNETELKQIARYIGKDQPVFGMRSGHEVMVKSAENIDRLAAHYSGEIQAAVPAGPLFIGGNCQAATIAFHVARHARAAGREVSLLVLHEKMVPERYAGRVALCFGRDSNRNIHLWCEDPDAECRAYYDDNFTIDIVSGGHGQFFQEPYILDLVAMIRRRRDEVAALDPVEKNPKSAWGRQQ